MINLYVSCHDLNEIKRFMETMFKDLSSANYDLAEYENRICILTRESLSRIEVDGRKLEGLQLKSIRNSQIDFILQT